MDIEERLKRIDEHFEHLTVEEFEKKLERAGINEIKSSADFGMEMVSVTVAQHLVYVAKQEYTISESVLEMQNFPLISFYLSEVA